MDTSKFISQYHNLIGSSEGESTYAALRLICPGLSSAKLGKLINKAVSLMDKDEIYCEIGTYAGYTLISASLYNSRNCIGIDNTDKKMFPDQEQRRMMRERRKFNLEHFKSPFVGFIGANYKNVNSLGKKVGVFLVDGEHTREECYGNLKWVYDKLSDEALIFVDDISVLGVYDGVIDFMKEHPGELVEFFHMDVCYLTAEEQHCNEVFWNGLAILRFKK